MKVGSPQPGRAQSLGGSASSPGISHPTLKGFGVSMLISIAYAWSIVFGPVYGTSELLLVVASFLPVFVLVNGLVALSYRRHRLGGVGRYVLGAVVALFLDGAFMLGLYWLILALLF